MMIVVVVIRITKNVSIISIARVAVLTHKGIINERGTLCHSSKDSTKVIYKA